MRRGALGCAFGIAVILIIVPPASTGQYWYDCPDSKAYYHAAVPDRVAAGCAVTTGPGPGYERSMDSSAPPNNPFLEPLRIPRPRSDGSPGPDPGGSAVS